MWRVRFKVADFSEGSVFRPWIMHFMHINICKCTLKQSCSLSSNFKRWNKYILLENFWHQNFYSNKKDDIRFIIRNWGFLLPDAPEKREYSCVIVNFGIFIYNLTLKDRNCWISLMKICTSVQSKILGKRFHSLVWN